MTVTQVTYYEDLCKQNVIFPQDIVSEGEEYVHILADSLHKNDFIIIKKVVRIWSF